MTRALILDIDGTLVDSNDANTRAWLQAFQEQGLDLPYQKLRSLVGMGGDQLIPAASGIEKGDPRFQALSDGWKRAFSRMLPDLKPFAHTRTFVEAVQRAGWRTVVATSGAPDLAAKLLDIAHVADLLPQRVSGEDVGASKPQPDLMHAALHKVGVKAGAAWMLGDTVYDVQAAHRAGVRCAFIRLGGNPDPEGADAVLTDLEDATQFFVEQAQ